MTSSNGNIFRVTGHLCGEFTGEFPAQRPLTRSFDVFFDLGLRLVIWDAIAPIMRSQKCRYSFSTHQMSWRPGTKHRFISQIDISYKNFKIFVDENICVTGIKFNPSMDKLLHTYPIKCGMKLLTRSQTVVPLKSGNGWVITSHMMDVITYPCQD